MKNTTSIDINSVWQIGNPVEVEKKFYQILKDLSKEHDNAIYSQILSQIALAQALQKRFDEAHHTLDEADKIALFDDYLSRVMLLLERGRVYQQFGIVNSDKSSIENAIKYFHYSYEKSLSCNFDYHTINAAHMIAIAENIIDEKIKWNRIAIELAEKTNDQNAKAWLGSLYNNLGHDYLKNKQYKEALVEFKKALICREKEGVAINIRVSKWAIARTLRLLNQLDEAELILNNLANEYNSLHKTHKNDAPIEMISMFQGLVYEELAELNTSTKKRYAQLAYDILSKDEMFSKTEPDRLNRLLEIIGDSNGI